MYTCRYAPRARIVMRDLEPIYRAIEFIEAHLCEDVTVADMASAAGFSLYHFIRTFNRVTRHTPYGYLMRRRMAEAARKLVSSDSRVVEIALDYQFNNHESFSRTFKRMFGLQPVQWRERRILPPHVLIPAFTYAYLNHINHPSFQSPNLTVCHQRNITGLMTSLKNQPEAGDQVWRVLGNFFSCKPERQDHTFYGVTSHVEAQEDSIFYFAGFETKHQETVEPVFASRVLPAAEYISVNHLAPLADLPLTWTYLYHTWLPKAGLKPAFPLEIASFGAVPPCCKALTEVELWLPVKKTRPENELELPTDS